MIKSRITYATWATIATANPSWLKRYVVTSSGYVAVVGHAHAVYETSITAAADIAYFDVSHKPASTESPTLADAFAQVVAIPAPSYDSEGNLVVSSSAYAFVTEKTRFKGFLYTGVPVGTTTNYDEKMTKSVRLQGGGVSVDDAESGDYIDFSVVDKDDVLGMFAALGYTVGVDVLDVDPYVQSVYIDPVGRDISEARVQAAGSVPAGLYLRLRYTATSGGIPRTVRLKYLYYEAAV